MTGSAASPRSAAPLTVAEVQALAAEWYRLLDIHAPAEQLLPLVAEQGLEMQFPEGPVSGIEAFRQWYEGVIRIFFDEVHTLTRADVTLRPEGGAEVDIVVNWQARRWRPPAARSEWLGFDAYQRWEVIRSPVSGQPVVRRYVVDRLEPMEGSVPL